MFNTGVRFIILFVAEDGEALYSQKKQDLELIVAQIISSLIAKFRLKLKKVGETTRPFRYDLNKIHYNSTVEVTNRFKELDLVGRLPEELGTEIPNTVHEAVTKTIPKEKKCRKAKWVIEKALQIGEGR